MNQTVMIHGNLSLEEASLQGCSIIVSI